MPTGLPQIFRGFYQEASTLLKGKAGVIQDMPLRAPLGMEQNLGMPLVEQAKLRDVRRSLECLLESDNDSEATMRHLCSQIEASDFSSPEDKAWSLYYLGVLELDHARNSGSLQELWEEAPCGAYDDKNIRSARDYLTRARLYSAESSDIFTRNTLRSLALVEGPKINNNIGMSAGILILASIGQSIRRKLTSAFGQNIDSVGHKSMDNLKAVFGVFDGLCKSDEERNQKIKSFLGELAARTPKNWGFVAPVMCPSGEMLIATIQKAQANPNEFMISTKCIFPSNGMTAYDFVVKPLDSILARVQEQLQGVDPSMVSKSDDKEATKRKWWDTRNRLDAKMCDLLDDVESLYFSRIFDEGAREDLSSSPSPGDDLDEFPCGNLTSRFEAAVNDSNDDRVDSEEEHQEKVAVLKKLTVPKLKDRLLEAGASKSQFRKLRKADLIELLIQKETDNETNEKLKGSVHIQAGDKTNNSDSCVFLILDENLHRFPFEGMSVLKGKTVCRVPCLSFVLATLLEFQNGPKLLPSVDPANVSYILDPENNLQATQDRLLPAIKNLEHSRKYDWEGVVGEIPPASWFSQGLCKMNGLTMYFGHGGAQVCFSRRRVEELTDLRVSNVIDSVEPATSCKATVLLMGCSSGKLVSINRKDSDSIEETPLYYEPEGIALSYLCAGAPCVIGNLWDVTDNDIDR